jgi:hypothetical protein
MLILSGICSFYSGNADDDVIQRTLGTVFSHLVFSIKQDATLGEEFLKMCRDVRVTPVLTCFKVSLLMEMSRIFRYHEQVFDFLKTHVLKGFKVCCSYPTV